MFRLTRGYRSSKSISRIAHIAPKAARVARLVFYTAAAVAADADPPAWTPEGLDVIGR